ncbi:MAG: alanine racemase [Candidatus Cloacimonetes bacterium]|nr:alanine racemase [Candidatus Cloacimonadota bacterium]
MAVKAIRERSWVEIDLDAFRANLKALRAFIGKDGGFIQIVKADAYGHGAREIARIALSEGAVALGVANPEEGKLLRIQGFKEPILILSPSLPSEIPDILAYNLWPTLSDPAFARELDRACSERGIKAKVSLKLDSGMHRSGALADEFGKLWKAVQKLPQIEVQSVFSHFAASESDPDFSRTQETEFLSALKKYRVQVPWLHLANSSAVVNDLGKSLPICRLGILSYGIYTHPSQKGKIALKPVMTFKSTVSQLKSIPAGATVGYNRSWKAARDTRYAVIPVGYADGYDFLLSNRGTVALNGSLCPVIGRVSMDMLCVDITDAGKVEIGDEVVLLGVEALRAEDLAAVYGGSAYELLCQVGRRAKRYYYQGRRLVTSAPLSRREFVSSDYPDSKLSQIIQAAISQRVNSEEMGELISREILRVFFFNKDREILYRKDFRHHIRFSDSGDSRFWRAKTTLSFTKTLQNGFFTVACANSEAALKSYFKRRDVEYRWLMDTNFELSPEAFSLSSVRINGIELETKLHFRNACMEIRCSHPALKELVGSEVFYEIDTLTLYPRSSHQLSVFITELTHGVKISFSYPEAFPPVECVPVFAGQNKYPRVSTGKNTITVSTKAGEWVFPQSGVVFAY